MSMKVLLTGGLGFIGHHTALRLKSAGMDVYCLDSFAQNIQNDWHRSVVNERIDLLRAESISIISGDTRSYENIRSALLETGASKVVHMSAIPSMVLSNKDPGNAIDHNFTSTRNILEAIRLEKTNVDQVVYFSSSTVYGHFETNSVNEMSPTRPIGIYEAAKLCSEIILKSYYNLTGTNYTILRPSALYGERCINNRVTQVFIEKALKKETLKIAGGIEERLDFTYISDVAEGVFLSLTNKNAINETFNITRGDGRPLSDLITILSDFFPDLKVDEVPRDKMRPKRGTLEIDKARNLLGYIPEVDLEQGYRRYIEWYLQSKFLINHTSGVMQCQA